MRFLVLLLALLSTHVSAGELSKFLLGADIDRRDKYVSFLDMKTADYYTTCLDGVAYWTRISTHNTWLAPRYDKRTKEVVTCEGDGIIDRNPNERPD